MENSYDFDIIMSRIKAICFENDSFYVEWTEDFKDRFAKFSSAQVDAVQPGLSETAKLLNRAYGRSAMISGETLFLNHAFRANPTVVETKVGAQIYVHTLESVKIVKNVVQLIGEFNQLERHRPRNKQQPETFYVIDVYKKLSRSLSITRHHLEKQFPGLEHRINTALALDMPLSDIKGELFFRHVEDCNASTLLPNDFHIG